MSKVAENIKRVQERIGEAATRAGRNPSDVAIVAVSKNVAPELINQVIEAGIKEIGENRVQELREKYELIGNRASWHFVGHLQKNKVKYIINFIKLIHSVESLSLAQEINKRAEKIDKIQDVLVQVNVSGEETKFGISPEELESFLGELSRFKHIKVKGLMTIAPLVEKEETKIVFADLSRLFNKAKKTRIKGIEMQYLSMGMTNDFEVAVEEGSNMIRVGTAVFSSSGGN